MRDIALFRDSGLTFDDCYWIFDTHEAAKSPPEIMYVRKYIFLWHKGCLELEFQLRTLCRQALSLLLESTPPPITEPFHLSM